MLSNGKHVFYDVYTQAQKQEQLPPLPAVSLFGPLRRSLRCSHTSGVGDEAGIAKVAFAKCRPKWPDPGRPGGQRGTRLDVDPTSAATALRLPSAAGCASSAASMTERKQRSERRLPVLAAHREKRGTHRAHAIHLAIDIADEAPLPLAHHKQLAHVRPGRDAERLAKHDDPFGNAKLIRRRYMLFPLIEDEDVVETFAIHCRRGAGAFT